MIAAGLRDAEAVELLLSSGANVFAIDSYMGTSALHKAVLSGNTAIIQILALSEYSLFKNTL
ncbi:ankyrin repeat domain-containing protein [Myroides odoratus]|uniref:ankyrin repeat domain-containing protein n=1 Tax=Myroides odoratus TaxID=256 RepID=UPI00191818D4|nr:ankyrin repeat domain-containing protein [Myroides odoratus]